MSAPAATPGHLAQPGEGERPAPGSWRSALLPSFGGERADLPLNRDAPARFAVTDDLVSAHPSA